MTLLFILFVQHGQKANQQRCVAPGDLMVVAENMLPKMILRLIQHLRDKRSELLYTFCFKLSHVTS